MFAHATAGEEDKISAEDQTTPPQSPSSAAKKNNNVLGDLEFPDAPDSPFIGADSATEDRDGDDEKTREDDEEDEMEDAQDSAFVIPNAPAGVAESDVSAFFADFHLPTPPRGQGVDDANKGVENKTESGEERESEERNQSVEPIAEEAFAEKKHLNFEDAKEEGEENDTEEEALTEIQL